MNPSHWRRLSNTLMLIAALVAIWQGLYWWVGDVALASPLATLRYTAKLVASETFQLETENGVAGVRGTEFRLEAAAGQPDTLRVYEGVVQVDDRRVESGHELRFRRGEKAEPRPFDAKSEHGHKFMDWVRTRPMKDGKEPGAIHHPDRNPERENRTREKHEHKH